MIDIDSIPVVLPDGSLWMDGEAITELHVYREKVPSTEQSYAGARRGLLISAQK